MSGFKRADEHDACFAIYTSGSTGRPKGVLQEYGKIKLNQASFERRPGDLVDERTCTALGAPLNFIAAVKIFLNALYSGMRLIVLTTDTARNPAQLRAQFERYQVNMAFLSPSILDRKLCEVHESYRRKIEHKTILPLEVRFVQPQTYALYRDLKVMGGASPNQIKPIHVIANDRLKRFFFGLLQQ